MKKGILVVLLIAFFAASMFLVAQAAKDKAEVKDNPAKIIERTPMEQAAKGVATPAVSGLPVVPESEKAPMPERTKAVRPTMSVEEALASKGITLTPEQIRQLPKEQVAEEFMEKPLVSCEFRPEGDEGCCYSYTNFRWFTGAEEAAEFTDPEWISPAYGNLCLYRPMYPLEIDSVRMMVQADDSCTIIYKAGLREVDWTDHLCPYPGAIITEVEDTIFHAGGTMYIAGRFPTPVCLYDRYFATFTFVWISNLGPKGGLGAIFSQTPQLCKTYDDWGAGFVDLSAYGAYPGAIRIRTYGKAPAVISCPADDEWYYKAAVEPYLPSGMPDFDQYQMGGVGEGAFSAPAALANCLKWVYCGGFPTGLWDPPDMGPLVCADPNTIPPFISWLAGFMGTNPQTGTNGCDAIETGLQQITAFKYEWLAEETYQFDDPILFPNPQIAFDLLQYQLRLSQDIILGIGFWYEDPPSVWHRIGGNYVTMAGVNKGQWLIAVSDPSTDARECGFCPFGQVLGAPHAPVCGLYPWGCTVLHNNNLSVSHDGYMVTPSVSPGGILQLADYGYVQGAPYFESFLGQNFPAKFVQYAGPMPNPAIPIHTEIECAVIICPGTKYQTGDVYSSKAVETNNNHGGIEAFYVNFGAGLLNGLYYGSMILGTNQADLNCDYGDYFPTLSFLPAGPPIWDYFTITGAAGDYDIEQLKANFVHSFIPDLEITMYTFGFWVPAGGTMDCEYALEDVYVLHNAGATDIIGLEKGFWLDLDISTNGAADLADFDQQHSSLWMYDVAIPAKNYGITMKPAAVGDVPVTGWSFSQAARVYDGQYLDSLKYWMENLGWGVDEPTIAEDRSIIIASDKFDIPAGGYHIEKFLKWGYANTILAGGDAAWRHFLYNVLHQEGFYRGDVNKDGYLNVTDVIYMINYLFKNGPMPIEFASQMDVSCDGLNNVTDVIYIINYLFKNGPDAIDKNRFFLESPLVDPVHKAAYQPRVPGLFGDPDWKTLGQ